MPMFFRRIIWLSLVGLSIMTTSIHAQEKASQKTPAITVKPVKATAETVSVEESTTVMPAENTLESCRDGIDNDGDGYVDCDDQDCLIFAICVRLPETETEVESEAEQDQTIVEEKPVFIPEMRWQCSDGLDNNSDGLVDCHEPSCQTTSYCRQIMYERPEPNNKAPGLFLNFGFGVAFPNFRLPTMETFWISEYGDQYNIPFDPDLGIMLDIQFGYLFLKFMGIGINLKSAFTGASNRSLYFSTDDDENYYKYTGSKYYGNMGAFLRFQWPFQRLTPFVNLHVGYSVAQATWNIYDSENLWSEIDDAEIEDDFSYLVGERTVIRSDRYRHFTFAVEPGLDVTVIPRLFTVGLKMWIPVIANKHSSADNLGALISFGFTPMWRESYQLRPEFAPQHQQ